MLVQGLRWTVTWAGFGRVVNHVEGSIVPVALLLVGAILLLAQGENRARAAHWLRRLGFLLFLVGILFLYHQGVRWIYREWYTLPITWSVWLAVGLGSSLLLERLSALSLEGSRVYRLAMAVWVVLLLLHGYQLWTIGIYSFQGGFFNLVNVVNALPEGSVVGISDSGYVGYRAERQIVNLDGVVNNQATEAFMEGSLMDYILETGIDYIHTQPRYLNETFYGPNYGFYLQPEGFFYRVLGDEAALQAQYGIPDSGRIDFGTPEAWKYAGPGWNRNEAPGEGIWADALEATVYAALPETQGDEPLRLRLHAMPFSHNVSETQTVAVTVNDVEVSDPIPMAPGELQVYEVTVPSGVMHDGVNTIELAFQYTIAPSAVGHNADTRTLAVWMDFIELLPASAP